MKRREPPLRVPKWAVALIAILLVAVPALAGDAVMLLRAGGETAIAARPR